MFHQMEGDRRKKRVTFWTKLLMLLRYRVDINKYYKPFCKL